MSRLCVARGWTVCAIALLCSVCSHPPITFLLVLQSVTVSLSVSVRWVSCVSVGPIEPLPGWSGVLHHMLACCCPSAISVGALTRLACMLRTQGLHIRRIIEQTFVSPYRVMPLRTSSGSTCHAMHLIARCAAGGCCVLLLSTVQYVCTCYVACPSEFAVGGVVCVCVHVAWTSKSSEARPRTTDTLRAEC
jgi:hypothetical protein